MNNESSLRIADRRSIVSNSFFSLIGTSSAVFTGLLVSVMTARYLGPTDLGLLSLIQWVRTTANIVLDVGLSSAVVKFVSEMDGQGDSEGAKVLTLRLLVIQICLALATSIVLSIFAPTVAMVMGNQYLTRFLPIAAVILFLSAINVFLRATLTGRQQFRVRTAVDILSSILTFCGIFVIIIRSYSIISFVFLEVIIALLQLFVFAFVFWRGDIIKVRGYVSNSVARSVLRYCTGVFLVTTLDAVIWQRSETFFLSIYSQPEQIAFYGLAFNIATLIGATLPAAIGGVLFPVLSQRFGAGRHQEMQIVYSTSTRLMAIVMLPLCVGGSAISFVTIPLIYGISYAPVAVIFSLLLIGTAIGSLTIPGAALLLALGKPARAVWWMVPIAIINLLLAYLLVPSWGALGAAIASITSQGLGVIAGTIYLNRSQKFHLPWRQLCQIAISTVPMAGIAYLLSQYIGGFVGLVVSIVVGAVIFVLTLMVSGALTEFDLSILEQMNFSSTKILAKFLRGVQAYLYQSVKALS